MFKQNDSKSISNMQEQLKQLGTENTSHYQFTVPEKQCYLLCWTNSRTVYACDKRIVNLGSRSTVWERIPQVTTALFVCRKMAGEKQRSTQYSERTRTVCDEAEQQSHCLESEQLGETSYRLRSVCMGFPNITRASCSERLHKRASWGGGFLLHADLVFVFPEFVGKGFISLYKCLECHSFRLLIIFSHVQLCTGIHVCHLCIFIQNLWPLLIPNRSN